MSRPVNPALIEAGGLEIQDVLVSLALVAGLILKFIFSRIAGAKTVVIPGKDHKANKKETI